MVDFLVELRRDRPALEFHVLGDQVFRSPATAEYADRLERSLTSTDGVTWHGAVSRDDVGRIVGQGGIALSLWDYAHGSRINDLVVSTKLLDYCAAGVPVILNRTAAQERILGEDYPLFVREPEEALPLIRALLDDAGLYERAAAACVAAADRYTYPRVHEGLAPFLDGRRTADLHTFDRPKLPNARFNIGLLDPTEEDMARAYALLVDLRPSGRPWRLVVGRSSGTPPVPGTDPALARLRTPPDRLRDRVSTRSVDDERNWWRTIGIALVPSESSAIALRAMASGAVTLGPERATVRTVRALADPAAWTAASAAARAVAFAVDRPAAA
jgi:hypothetical protein